MTRGYSLFDPSEARPRRTLGTTISYGCIRSRWPSSLEVLAHERRRAYHREMRWALAVAAASSCVLVILPGCDSAVNSCSEAVGQGVACSNTGLCCDYPNTECGTCYCDGTRFICSMNGCSPQAPPCPNVVAPGGACAIWPFSTIPQSSCPSTVECGSSCTCGCDGHWQCTAGSPCADAGVD